MAPPRSRTRRTSKAREVIRLGCPNPVAFRRVRESSRLHNTVTYFLEVSEGPILIKMATGILLA